MADNQKQDLDKRKIGVIIGAAGLVLFVLGALGLVRQLTIWGVIAVIVGVIVLFVGINDKKKWEEVKKDLYPEGEDAAGESR